MSSHILAEVSRLAQRIGIIHNGHLLQELNVEELERNRRRRLLLRARDVEAARQALVAAGHSVTLRQGGVIELNNGASAERPDDIASLLVRAGAPAHSITGGGRRTGTVFSPAGGPGWRRAK